MTLAESTTMPPPAFESTPRHFAFVDALRGFAILGVICYHVGTILPATPGPMMKLVGHGDQGVQLFFVISAFTLFWSLRERSRSERKPLHAFYVRRFFRIAPLFWLATAFYLWQVPDGRAGFAPNGVGIGHIVATLLFVHGWYPSTINSVVPGGWSIAAEVMFYLCLPILFHFVRTRNGALWAIFISLILLRSFTAFAFHMVMPHFPHGWENLVSEFIYFSFPSQLPVFLLGILLYFLLCEPGESAGGWKRNVLFPIAGAYLLLNPLPGQLCSAICFVLIAYGLAKSPLRIAVNPFTQFVGKVSFSAYIWHFWMRDHLALRMLPQVRGMNGYLQYVAILLAVLVPTLLVSTVSFYLIEQPGQDLGKWVIRRMNWGRVKSSA